MIFPANHMAGVKTQSSQQIISLVLIRTKSNINQLEQKKLNNTDKQELMQVKLNVVELKPSLGNIYTWIRPILHGADMNGYN